MPTPRAVAYLQGRYLPSRRSNREFLLEIGGDTVMTSDLSWGTCRTRANFILEIAATCVIILENPVRRQAAVFFYTRFQPGVSATLSALRMPIAVRVKRHFNSFVASAWT